MKLNSIKLMAAALAATAPMALSTPAIAQARGVGVVDVESAVGQTTAYTIAVQQIQTTFGAQITAAQARATALQAELAPLQQTLQAAQQAPGATAESVRPAYEALATRQQAAEREMAQLNGPVLRSREYVREQILIHANAALQAAMTASNVDLVLNPSGVLGVTPGSPANITPQVTAQLNQRVTSAQITPPAGWNPGDTLRASQQAQQPAAQPQQQPEGR